MAEAVRPLPRLRSTWRLPAVSPAFAFAIRSAVAVTAAIWLGKAPGLVENNSTWILITVLMLLQPTTGASMMKGLLRAAGTLAAAITAIVLFGFAAQNPPLLMACMFAVHAVAAYGFTGQRFQYAWEVWAFTTVVVLGSAMAGQAEVEVLAFSRASMVLIGIVLVMVVDSLFWPARAEPELRESLASRARSLGEGLGRAIATFASHADVEPEFPAPDPGALGSQLSLVAASRSELGVSRDEADRFERFAVLLEALASSLRVLSAPTETSLYSEALAPGLARALSEFARRVEAALAEFASALKASRPLVSFSADLEHALLAVEAERYTLVRSEGWNSELERRVAELRDLVAIAKAMESTFVETDSSKAEGGRAAGFDLRPDAFRLKIALRTGFAVIFAFLVPAILGWPMNTMVGPVAFVFALLTRGAAVLTLSSLAEILAIGWITADLLSVFVTPHLERAPLAMLVPFAIAFAFALVSVGRPRFEALPSIGGLVAFLSVFGSASAPTSVYGPYSTVCYIGTALIVGWIFSRSMWPASAAGLFRERVAALLDGCCAAVRDARSGGDADRGRREEILTRSFSVHSAQLGSLHVQASHEPVERGLDPARRARILTLSTELMDAIADYRPGVSDSLLTRGGEALRPLLLALQQQHEALVASMRSVVGVMRDNAEHAESGLTQAHRAVTECVESLRADPNRVADLDDTDKRQLLIALARHRTLVSRQLAIESWFDEWREAQAARASAPSPSLSRVLRRV